MVNEWIRLGQVCSLFPGALVKSERGKSCEEVVGLQLMVQSGSSRWKSHGQVRLPYGVASRAADRALHYM